MYLTVCVFSILFMHDWVLDILLLYLAASYTHLLPEILRFSEKKLLACRQHAIYTWDDHFLYLRSLVFHNPKQVITLTLYFFFVADGSHP